MLFNIMFSQVHKLPPFIISIVEAEELLKVEVLKRGIIGRKSLRLMFFNL